MFILVVDDNLLSCTRLLHRLREAGWDAAGAGACAEGLARARERRPDAVVVNLAPGLRDGAAFVHSLRADAGLARVPVLGYCGHRDVDRRRLGLAAGCDQVASNSAVTADIAALVRSMVATAGPRG